MVIGVQLTGINKDQDVPTNPLVFLRPYSDEAGILQVPLFGEKGI